MKEGSRKETLKKTNAEYNYDVIKRIVAERRYVRFNHASSRVLLFISLSGILFTSVIILLSSEYISYPYSSSVVVPKISLTKPISAIIRNDGDLDAVKHVYTTRYKGKKRFLWKRDSPLYYSYETSLTDVLNDMKCDYLSADPFVCDTVYYRGLLNMIIENEYHNPFDNLGQNQRYYFENIRTKTGKRYSSIQDDVSKIADELQNKNQLVEKYLNKSSFSFIISLVALIITIVLSIIQIVQSSKVAKAIKLSPTNVNNENK